MFLTTNPQINMKTVPEVDLNRYAGTWYEIARLPNSFEKKLKCPTATYTIRDDGKIKVVNKGHYITNPSKINTATGVAWVPDKSAPGKLKVSFFWPFNGNYWILYLDKDYKFVLIGEPGLKYLWILARDKKLDDNIYTMLLQKSVEVGYDLRPLIKVDQDCE
jgi:apolipoprotein D and lipocalin family protein